MNSNNKLINRYFYFWALFMPITSILIIPSWQGTTPAFIFALTSIFIAPIIGGRNQGARYFYTIIVLFSSLALSVMLSELSLGLYPNITDLSKGTLINQINTAVLFRPSVITQSIYMVGAMATFSFVRAFYNRKWDKYILAGSLVLALYGFYEFVYFLIFKTNGDFLSNRMFGQNMTHSGSLFETMTIGGVTFERLKSLTGEPSMYAFSVLPFFLYSLYLNKKKTSILLGISLCLSSSTGFIIGMIFASFFMIKKYLKYIRKSRLRLAIFFPITIAALFGLIIWFSGIFYQTVWAKVTLQNSSGSQRFSEFQSNMDIFNHLPLANQIFGVGFGTIRSTDFFSTSLVNIGIIGFIALTIFMLLPIYAMKNDGIGKTLKLTIFITYLTMMISVPEFSYLPTWLFLGIAYNKIYCDKRLLLKEKPGINIFNKQQIIRIK